MRRRPSGALPSAALFAHRPVTLSFSAWFADTGLFALALVVGLGGYGLWAALRSEIRTGYLGTPIPDSR